MHSSEYVLLSGIAYLTHRQGSNNQSLGRHQEILALCSGRRAPCFTTDSVGTPVNMQNGRLACPDELYGITLHTNNRSSRVVQRRIEGVIPIPIHNVQDEIGGLETSARGV